ncbi:hypothetical protein CP533_1118 [Ophiocordyceps camponoti-saundersi (nom. inval.)]|nr:hypothetical protein CP533_1118 [Ophiocordyceps camponoti-saundersi (nom. inval.)]
MLRLVFFIGLLSKAAFGQYPAPTNRNVKPPAGKAPLKTVVQFPPEVWIENIAARSNGHLLCNQLLPKAALIEVSNPLDPSPYARVVHEFPPSISGLTGICEPSKDSFVVVGYRFAKVGDSAEGSAESYSVNFNNGAYNKGPLIRRIGKHPDMVFPNGLAALPGVDDVVLVADSTLGLVWRLYLESGKTEVAIKVPEMALHPGTRLKIGVNGIKVINGYLWWSNSYVGEFYRVKIDKLGNKLGYPELMYRYENYFIDDFAFDERGIWGTTNQNNTVMFASSGGEIYDVAGAQDSPDVAADTSCVFGRTAGVDDKILFVATGNTPKKGRGAKVVAVDTSTIYWP